MFRLNDLPNIATVTTSENLKTWMVIKESTTFVTCTVMWQICSKLFYLRNQISHLQFFMCPVLSELLIILYLLVKLDLAVLELWCKEKLWQSLIFCARYSVSGSIISFSFWSKNTWCKDFPLRSRVGICLCLDAYNYAVKLITNN